MSEEELQSILAEILTPLVGAFLARACAGRLYQELERADHDGWVEVLARYSELILTDE